MRPGARALAIALLTLPVGVARSHGGVSMENDVCIMKIGTYRAHFSGYQPEFRATQEFCEDIPEVGKAIIVLDFVDPALRKHIVEFRVLNDVGQLGKGARYEALGGPEAIEAATLFHLPPQAYPRGTLTFEQQFQTAAWYIGVLSATDPATGATLHSVFPFQVGVRNPWRYLPALVLVIGLAVLAYRLTSRPPVSAKS